MSSDTLLAEPALWLSDKAGKLPGSPRLGCTKISRKAVNYHAPGGVRRDSRGKDELQKCFVFWRIGETKSILIFFENFLKTPAPHMRQSASRWTRPVRRKS